MQVVIVYESLFGNTHEIAEAVGEGVLEARPDTRVECVRVADADQGVIDAADLLVVGGPTHMRGMTTGVTRKLGLKAEQNAEQKAERTAEQKAERTEGPDRNAAAAGHTHHGLEPGAEGPGVRDWFQALPKAAKGVRAAAFDTRGDVRLAGGAAPGIARRLRRHGYKLVTEPEGFIVEDSEGPLRAGEHERARRWGAALVG